MFKRMDSNSRRHRGDPYKVPVDYNPFINEIYSHLQRYSHQNGKEVNL